MLFQSNTQALLAYQPSNNHQDINNSGDGGIYAELIQNRAFQYSHNYSVSTAHYFPINAASLSIVNSSLPLSKALPASMRVAAPANCSGSIGFKNEGYWGIDVRVQPYNGSFWVKGAYNGTFTASLASNLTNEVFGSVEVESKAVDGKWTEHVFVLTPEKAAPNSNNTFGVTFDSERTASGALEFDLISLFPPTWKGRKNGLRVDIAQALADMNPVSQCIPPPSIIVRKKKDDGTNVSSTSSASPAATCSKASQTTLTGTGKTHSARSKTVRASRASGDTSKPTAWA